MPIMSHCALEFGGVTPFARRASPSPRPSPVEGEGELLVTHVSVVSPRHLRERGMLVTHMSLVSPRPLRERGRG